MLTNYFEQAGRPALIFVMYFPNDVDADYSGVVKGTLPNADARWRQSLEPVPRMEQFARARGSTLVVAAIPPVNQVAERQSPANYQDVLRVFSRGSTRNNSVWKRRT